MTVYNIREAKTHFSRLLRQVMRGEEGIIAEAGEPVARLMPVEKAETAVRVPGMDKGKVVIQDNFDAPLLEFVHVFEKFSL
jgi:prevent-host-death family protein